MKERKGTAEKAIRWGLLVAIVAVVLAAVLESVLTRRASLEQGAEGKSPSPPPGHAQVAETPIWMNVYSPSSLLDEGPLPPGAVIEAYDPQGVLSGRFVVVQAGKYGLMPIYGDDPSTARDEGALPGDTITFLVNGNTASSTPARVLWTTYGDLQRVDLYASSPAQAPPGWFSRTGRSLRRLFDR